MTLGVAAPAYDRIDPRAHSAVSERALFHGYARVGRRRTATVACACGLAIVAELSEQAVRDAVDEHNRLPVHVAWRSALEDGA